MINVNEIIQQTRAEVLAAALEAIRSRSAKLKDWPKDGSWPPGEKATAGLISVGLDEAIELLKKLQPAAKALEEYGKRVGAEALARHTSAVADFLNELYAVMVDPLAEGVISVEEMKRALLEAAIRDRQAEADREASLRQAEIKGRLHELKEWPNLCEGRGANVERHEIFCSYHRAIAELEKARAILEKK